ncbi:hypothetical protein FB107DRAFT_225015 [Schizophyllum commune]
MRALATRDLLAEISEYLSPHELWTFVQVSSAFELAGTPTLWRQIPGLQPLLWLIPDHRYDWAVNTKLGKDKASLDLDLSCVTDEQWKLVRRRACFVKHITFHYMDTLLELAIYSAFKNNTMLAPLLPALQSIEFCLAKPLPLFATPWTPLGLDDIPGVMYSCRIEDLIIPHARTVLMGGMASSVKYLDTLHIDGQPLNFVRCILDTQEAWRFDELCVGSLRAAPAQVICLLSTISRRCPSLRRLSLTIDCMDDDQEWSVTPDSLLTLAPLARLVDLNIEAPMVSLLSDLDWKETVAHWPLIKHMRIITRVPWDCRRMPPPAACTLFGVLAILTARPGIHSLALPGVDCTVVPPITLLEEAVRASPSQSGFALLALDVQDSPVADPVSVGSVLRFICPALRGIFYGRAPWETEVLQTMGNIAYRRGAHVKGWDGVERYLVDHSTST